MKNILITGITGQDGVFLSSEILEKHSDVNIYGISRKNDNSTFFSKLNSITKKEEGQIKILNINLENFEETKRLIKDINPSFVYNLTGPSSVYESILNPEKTSSQITNIFNNLTNALVENSNFCNFFQASSSEMFGVSQDQKLSETSAFNPNSPYAKAKLENHYKILELSDRHEWKIYSGIMFNHESQFRDNDYLFMKIINGAIDIRNKKIQKLTLGSLDYIRDWSYAGDIAKAIYKINNSGKANTYVIGSGKGHEIRNVVEIVFDEFNLNMTQFIDIDQSFLREGDPISIISDPTKIKEELNWYPEIDFEKLIKICIQSKI